MSGRKFVIAGIGTDVGKTVASAILCEALKADYWKPVQAGNLFNSDSDQIAKLTITSSPHSQKHTQSAKLTKIHSFCSTYFSTLLSLSAKLLKIRRGSPD